MATSVEPQVQVRDRKISLRWGALCVQLPAGPLRLGHLGCKTLDTLKPPADLKQRWNEKFGKAWSRPGDKTRRLAKALEVTLEWSGMTGLLLIDTMRFGSDRYRPGDMMTAAADLLRRACPGCHVWYARDDDLCPAADLLAEAKKEAWPSPSSAGATRSASRPAAASSAPRPWP